MYHVAATLHDIAALAQRYNGQYVAAASHSCNLIQHGVCVWVWVCVCVCVCVMQPGRLQPEHELHAASPKPRDGRSSLFAVVWALKTDPTGH